MTLKPHVVTYIEKIQQKITKQRRNRLRYSLEKIINPNFQIVKLFFHYNRVFREKHGGRRQNMYDMHNYFKDTYHMTDKKGSAAKPQGALHGKVESGAYR
jgi:hypothetical protein